jgi:TPR repeat protein
MAQGNTDKRLNPHTKQVKFACKARMKKFSSHLIAILLATGTSHAGPWEDGYAAYRRQDYITAVALWKIVADTGNPQAQSLLGLMHFFGQGVPQNYATALTWLYLAAAQGEPKAQFKLGSMHGNGQGVKRDKVRAAMWFILASESGHPQAQKALRKISAEFSPAQIEEANNLAQNCMNRAYKACELD